MFHHQYDDHNPYTVSDSDYHYYMSHYSHYYQTLKLLFSGCSVHPQWFPHLRFSGSGSGREKESDGGFILISRLKIMKFQLCWRCCLLCFWRFWLLLWLWLWEAKLCCKIEWIMMSRNIMTVIIAVTGVNIYGITIIIIVWYLWHTIFIRIWEHKYFLNKGRRKYKVSQVCIAFSNVN